MLHRRLSCLIIMCIPIHHSSVFLANGSVPGALLHVLAHGALPCRNVLCQNPKSQSLQIPVLSFPFIIWQFSQQRGLLGVLLKRPFFPATKQLRRNKGSKPVRTHMKLAKYRSHAAVRSAFCRARSPHLVQTTWLRQRNSIWLSNHQSTTAWPREWIQLDNTVETWLLGFITK